MSNTSRSVVWLAAVVTLCASAAAVDQSVTVTRNIASMPLAFTENRGQWDDRVLFRANASGAKMWFTTGGAYYQFTRRVPVGQDPRNPDEHSGRLNRVTLSAVEGQVSRSEGVTPSGVEGRPHQPDSIESIAIKTSFVGANPNPQMTGIDAMGYKCNYFIGNDPDEWHTDVPNFEAIIYEDIYPGIDLKYYGNGKQMEYDFIVSPGADVAQIRVQYEGAKSVTVNSRGDLIVETEWNTITEARPFVYQDDGATRRELAGMYVLLDDNTFGFELGHDYDPAIPVVIDPTIEYSSYLGGSADDTCWAIAVDNSGMAVVTGGTYSSDFPIETPYQINQGDQDAFVTKLNSTGDGLIFSTYLGGGSVDRARAIAVDANGHAFVTGHTFSSDYPTENPFQTVQGEADVFVTQLNSSGNGLIYSTYLGASGWEYGNSIALDDSGHAFLTGNTLSSNFPTENPYQIDPGLNATDAFVTKLNSSGNGLIYSTYLGGSYIDYSWCIVVDDRGSAFVAGYTFSSDFPTKNPFQTDQGERDVFVTKFNSTGDSLIYSTYLGSSGADVGAYIAVTDSGNIIVTGSTWSSDFPVQYPLHLHRGYYDAFVTILSGAGDSLIYSTYLGGTDHDYVFGAAADGQGNAIVAGYTDSRNFPTLNPLQTDPGDNVNADVYLTVLDGSGKGLLYSTYLGGGGRDRGHGLALDDSGNVYVTGSTDSPDFPTSDPYQTYQGGGDGFVAKLSGPFGCCIPPIRGDVNLMSEYPNIADVTWLVFYMFEEGELPPCWSEANVDGVGPDDVNGVNIGDLVYLVDYLFHIGPEPVACP
ncbi:MAG: SBBP repeat-containing protein [candidate division Zixibacteria bacterium]|nr:SBBP repeat-containing protein [candidate division Zixibacteria bacterium]MDH3938857.1 SBBP repeat-containing protein [candidate division Zixibacteria bacterium]MDH4033178.1 SBBP repeat-containing protein [candidate division Zixibacteria bacterium]